MNARLNSKSIFVLIILTASVLACGLQPEPAADAPSAEATALPESESVPSSDPVGGGTIPTLDAEFLQGAFDITGVNPDGSEYPGSLNITFRDAHSIDGAMSVERFDLTWGDGAAGMGMLISNVLVTSFGGSECGVVYYGVAQDMSLGGAWFLSADSPSPGLEFAEPATARSILDGDYIVSGVNPDGSRYEGQMRLVRQDQVWQLMWDIDGIFYDGIGVYVEIDDTVNAYDYLAAAFGGEGCGVGIYLLSAENTLTGIWALWGFQGLGTEQAVKQTGNP